MIRGPYTKTAALQWVEARRFGPATRRNYLSTMVALDRRVRARRPGTRLAGVTEADVEEFVLHREDGALRADRSRQQTLNICWAMFNWAASPKVGLLEVNPAAELRDNGQLGGRNPQPVIRRTWLGEARAKLLVSTTRGDGTDPDRRRDAFVLALFLYTGLRLAELHALRWRDVDLGAGLLHVVGKGNKVAQVPLNAAARRLLFEWRSAYITGYGSDAIDDLAVVPRMMTGQSGQPCTTVPQRRWRAIQWGRPIAKTSGIWKIVRTRAAEAGLDHVAPHDLRRSFAGIMRDRGASLEEISKALRHTSLETTRIYLENKPELAAGLEDYDLG